MQRRDPGLVYTLGVPWLLGRAEAGHVTRPLWHHSPGGPAHPGRAGCHLLPGGRGCSGTECGPRWCVPVGAHGARRRVSRPGVLAPLVKNVLPHFTSVGLSFIIYKNDRG